MTLPTFIDGYVLTASTLNAVLNNAYPRPVAGTPYTGTGFDASRTDSNGTTTNNTILTVAANTVYDYVKIVILANVAHENTSGSNYGIATLKIETSVASAGSWTTLLNKQVGGAWSTQSLNTTHSGLITFEFYYAPTASEKSTGLDIRITGTADVVYTSSSCGASITNVQTMIYAN
jgi:hypothetical protein